MKGKWLEYNGFNKNVLNTTQLLLSDFGGTLNKGRLVS